MMEFWKYVPHPSLMAGLAAFVLGAVISLFIIPEIVKVARLKGLTDKPNERTSHKGRVPSLGGIAIFSGVLIASALLWPPDHASDPINFIRAATFLLFIVGQVDDIAGLTWKKKLAAEVVASLIIIVLGNFRFTTLFGLFGIWDLPEWMSVAFSLFVFIGIINAFNLIDGIDGLAAGMGILASFLMGCWLIGVGQHGYAVISWSLTGSLLPFFFFNVFGKKWKLFMGDTGSLMIGMLMAMFSTVLVGREMDPAHPLYMESAPVVAIAILIYPIFDTLRVFSIRIAQKRSPFSADKNHIHHLFLRAGWSHRRSSFYIVAINGLFILFALMMRNAPILPVVLSMLIGSFLITEVVRYKGKLRDQKALRSEKEKTIRLADFQTAAGEEHRAIRLDKRHD